MIIIVNKYKEYIINHKVRLWISVKLSHLLVKTINYPYWMSITINHTTIQKMTINNPNFYEKAPNKIMDIKMRMPANLILLYLSIYWQIGLIRII